MAATEEGDFQSPYFSWMQPAAAPAPAAPAPTFTPIKSPQLQLTQAGMLGGPTQQWQGGGEGGNWADIPQVWQAAQYNYNGQNLSDDLGAYVTNGDATHALQGGTSGVIANNQADYDKYQASLAAKLGLDPTGRYLLGHSDLNDGIQQSTIYRVDPTTGQLTQAAANQYKPQSDWTGFWRPALEGSAAVIGASLGLAGAYGALGGAGAVGSDAGMSLAEGAYPAEFTAGDAAAGDIGASGLADAGSDYHFAHGAGDLGNMGGAGSPTIPSMNLSNPSWSDLIKQYTGNSPSDLLKKTIGTPGSGGSRGGSGSGGLFSASSFGGMSPGDRYRQQMMANALMANSQRDPGFQSVWSGPPQP